MPFTFKVGESIKKAWGLYKENFGNIILFIFVMFILQMVVNSLFIGAVNTSLTFTVSSIPSLLFYYLISIIFGFIIAYLWIRASIDAIDGKGFKPFSKASLSFTSFWNFIKTNILMFLAFVPMFLISMLIVLATSIIGKAVVVFLMIATFVVYFYLMYRIYPALYVSIDKNVGARQSFVVAWNITKGHFWSIFGNMILIGLFMLVGILALFVGILITYPVGMIVMVMLYRELLKFKEGGAATASTVAPEVSTTPATPATPVMSEVAQVSEEVK